MTLRQYPPAAPHSRQARQPDVTPEPAGKRGQVATSGIVVADLSGNYVTTLDSGDGVEGLALDGGTLYAALAGQDAVAAIQASSITATTTTPTQALYPLGTGDIPYSLAVQSGKVWVSYQTACVAPNGDITPGTTDSFEADPAVVPAPGSSWSPGSRPRRRLPGEHRSDRRGDRRSGTDLGGHCQRLG